MKQAVLDLLNSKAGDALFADAIAELVSKRQYELLAFEDELSADELSERLSDGEALMLNPACRMVRQDAAWYVNGERIDLDDRTQALFERLIAGELIAHGEVSNDELQTLSQWLNDNWLVLV